MADNFLERRMEDMRSGRLRESVRAKGMVRTQAQGASRRLSLSFPDLRVLVVADTDDALAAVVETMRAAGLRTAFGCGDIKKGNALAQKSGARFYAYDAVGDIVADMKCHWDGVDFIMRSSDISGEPDRLRKVFRIALSMMHPDNGFIESLRVGTADGYIVVSRRGPGEGEIPEILVSR